MEMEGDGAQKRLAARVGCSSPAITYILEGHQQSSRLVGPISAAIGISPPDSVPLEKSERALLEKLRSLSPAERAAIEATLDALVAAKVGAE